MGDRLRRPRRHFATIPNSLARDGTVSTNARMLWVILMTYADSADQAFPSKTTLARDLGASVSTVHRAMRELATAGLVVVTPRFDERGDRTSNLYDLVTHDDPPVTHDMTPPVTHDTEKKTQIDQYPSEEDGQVVKRRPRDLVWDALVDIFGDPETPTERGKRNRAVKGLKEAGATPNEIRQRAATWPLHFETATLTDTALEKHWTTLGRVPMRASSGQINQLGRAQRMAAAQAADEREGRS